MKVYRKKKKENFSKPAKNDPLRPVKSLLWFVIKLLNIIVLLTLLTAAFSDQVSPERFVFCSYLGLFFPFILLGNLVVFFVWLIFWRWKLVLLNLLVILACSGSIHTYFPLHGKTKVIPETAIKILTYNVMRFEWIKQNRPGHPNKVLQYIKDSDADIVCLQEYGATKDKSGYLSQAEILKAMKKYPYHYILPLDSPFNASQIYALAIFSKFPILSSKQVPYNSEINGSFVTELDIHGKKVTLINNHLESNRLSEEERTSYYRLTQEIDTRSLDNFTQMMSKRLSPAYKIRAHQAQVIDQIIKANKNPYLIVCGDFNDTPISYSRHKIRGNLRDAFVDSGCGLGITYNKHRFLFRIDYILHSHNIKSYNCEVGKLRNSDHYPLSCYLQLN